MFKQLFISIAIAVALFQNSAALDLTECPSIADIKNVSFNEDIWHPLNVNNGEPISNAELATLAANTNHTQMAEYMVNAPEGATHCYYGNNDEWSEFYLVSTSKLLPYGNNWHYLSDEVWQCTPNDKTNCEWRYGAS